MLFCACAGNAASTASSKVTDLMVTPVPAAAWSIEVMKADWSKFSGSCACSCFRRARWMVMVSLAIISWSIFFCVFSFCASICAVCSSAL